MAAMNYKSAIDFLIYSYFKVTTASEQGDIIDAAINKAFSDATAQGAFNTIVSPEDKENAENARESSYEVLKDCVDSLVYKNYFEDNWHKTLCDIIVGNYEDVKSIKGERAFTYGNAQKWVNMTLKNMYVIALAFDATDQGAGNCQWVKNILDKSEQFHIPLDNIILRAAYGKFDSLKENYIKESGKKEKQYRIISGMGNYLWSQIPSYEVYNDFQKKLIDSIESVSPIDWECVAWLEQKLSDGSKEDQDK